MRFILLVLVYMVIVDCVERCSHPQAEDGHQISEGCLLRTCKAGVWRTSLAGNLCCYERTAYTINTTISSSMSKDGCVKADIDCVEEIPGQAKMILSMKNYCEEFATQEQIEEIKELLVRQREAGAGCQGGGEEGEEKEDVSDPCTWTPWLDRDNTTQRWGDTGDFEEFDKEKTVGDFSGCSFEAVQIRVVGQTEVFTSEGGVFSGTGDVVHITEKGMYCKWTSGEQADGECHDYEVKLCCLKN